MKKLVITAAAVAAMVSGAGVAVHVTGSQNDPIFEANVEALANGEGVCQFLHVWVFWAHVLFRTER